MTVSDLEGELRAMLEAIKTLQKTTLNAQTMCIRHEMDIIALKNRVRKLEGR